RRHAMQKSMLAVVIGLLARSVLADACPAQAGTPPGCSSDRVKFLSRLQGRVLGSLIRDGMTDEEVVRILGKGDKPLPTAGLVGGVLFMWRQYGDNGVTVSFISDNAGVLRVDSVTLWPLVQ